MQRRAHFSQPRNRRSPHARQQLLRSLQRAFCPAELLPPIRRHARWQLAGHREVGEKMRRPACEVGAIAQVEVFRQRIVLPTARRLDGLAPPDAASPVEIHERTRRRPRALLDDKVGINPRRLRRSEQRIQLVEMRPARLHKAYARLQRQHRHRTYEEVARRHKVRVENRAHAPRRSPHPFTQRARFEPHPLRPTDDVNVHAFAHQLRRDPVHECARLIIGIIEHLYLVSPCRIRHRRRRPQDALGDIWLVEKRELRGHHRPFGDALRPRSDVLIFLPQPRPARRMDQEQHEPLHAVTEQRGSGDEVCGVKQGAHRAEGTVSLKIEIAAIIGSRADYRESPAKKRLIFSVT